jgi:hypothetical protein
MDSQSSDFEFDLRAAFWTCMFWLGSRFKNRTLELQIYDFEI